MMCKHGVGLGWVGRKIGIGIAMHLDPQRLLVHQNLNFLQDGLRGELAFSNIYLTALQFHRHVSQLRLNAPPPFLSVLRVRT